MTAAPPARTHAAPAPRAAVARIEIAWTVSAGALRGESCYASAALHLEGEWPAAERASRASCSAVIDRAGVRIPVPLAEQVVVDVERRGRWTHVTLHAAGATTGPALLLASFELGRMAYCTSSVPALAGLPGASYDPPTGILELYEGS